MRLPYTLFASLGSLLAVAAANQHAPLHARHAAPAAAAMLSARGEGGWNEVQQDPGTIVSNIPIRGGQVELYARTRDGQDFSKLKRIVFVVHGKGRDPWNYLAHSTAALQKASGQGLVRDDEVGVWAPAFWCQRDAGAWPADASGKSTSNLLIWNESDWQYGANNVFPENIKDVSSFEVLEHVMLHFSNKAIFPNVETIVFASHSMGAQLLQRFAILGNMPEVGPEVHFFAGNPGAYLYLTSSRPVDVGGVAPVDQCPDFNDFYFGLGGVDANITYGRPTPNPDLLLQRYKSRYFHHGLSQLDDGPGNTQCAAHVTGDSHRTRGAAWYGYMESLGGFSANHTIDWVAECSHSDQCIFESNQGMQRLFVENSRQNQHAPSFTPNGPYNNLFPGQPQYRAFDGGLPMPSGTRYIAPASGGNAPAVAGALSAAPAGSLGGGGSTRSASATRSASPGSNPTGTTSPSGASALLVNAVAIAILSVTTAFVVLA